MKTVLINPNTSGAKGINKATIEPPLGIVYLASFLAREGFECSVIDANILQLSEEEVLNRIDRDTKIIGISFNIVSAIAAFNLVKYLKANLPNSIYIAGGPHPSSMPELCLNEFKFDAVCIGEGEEVLLEIAGNIDQGSRQPFRGVRGIYYRDANQVFKNSPRELIKNLDTIPYPDLGLLPGLLLYRSRARAKPVGTILISRGCPYQCIYCNKNIFQATYRFRSVENVIEEIEQQVVNFKIKQIEILDDNLTLNFSYAHRLFDEILNRRFNLHINLQNGVRADLVDEELIKKMKRSGVFKVSVGVESGDELIQQRIKKHLNLNKVLEATRLFKKYGIKVYGNFMLGLPYDTAQSMQRTIDFAIKMNPDIANFMITIPLPGTELYRLIEQEGTFLENLEHGTDRGFYGGKVYYRLDGMDVEDIIKYYKRSYKQFYFRPKKIVELICGINSAYEIRWIWDAIVEVSKTIF